MVEYFINNEWYITVNMLFVYVIGDRWADRSTGTGHELR